MSAQCCAVRIVSLIALVVVLSESTCADIRLLYDTQLEITEVGSFDTASGELRTLLRKYLLLALNRTDTHGSGDTVRFIIESRASRWEKLPQESLQSVSDIDAFEIVVAEHPTPTITITGQTPMSTGYGVMHFLEEHIGIAWVFPGELGLCLPKQRSFLLREGRKRRAPWTISRFLSGMAPRDPDWNWPSDRERTGVLQDARGFFASYDYVKSLKLHLGGVHHHMAAIFPVDQLATRHPEVFPVLPDGSRFIPQPKGRSSKGGKNAFQAWHPCYTNPKSLEIAVTRGHQEFDAGQVFFSLGINDGRRVQCQCDECQQVGWPQSYYEFVKGVAEAVKDRYPPQMVGVLAYGDVGIPPTDLQLPENVIVNVAGNRKIVWESLAPSLGTYEYVYGARYVIPNLPLDVIQENMRYYHKQNLRIYYAEMYPVWAFDAPKAYIISRLLWDHEQDVYDLLREFCNHAFGDAGEPMFRFYEHLAAIRRKDARPGEFTQVWNREWPFREALQFFRCPPNLHQNLSACLKDAKHCTLTEPEQKRLAMIEAFAEFSATYYEMHRLKEDVLDGCNDPDSAIAVATDLQQRRDHILAELDQHPEWFLGSSVKAGSFFSRGWPVHRLDQELATARTAAESLRGDPPLEADIRNRASSKSPCRVLPLRKQEHAWYKPTQHLPMKLTTADRHSFSFQTSPNVVIRDDEDPRHVGRPKAQWLHALVRDVAVAQDHRYVLQCRLRGTAGLVRVRVSGAARTASPERLELLQTLRAFPADEAEVTLRLVVDPSRYVAQKGGPTDTTADTVGTISLQLYFLWRPDNPYSELVGEVSLQQLAR
jgi:hypothetical protein